MIADEGSIIIIFISKVAIFILLERVLTLRRWALWPR